MKKIFTKIILISVFMSGVFIAHAQNSGTNDQAEAVGSGNTPSVSIPGTQALLDHQFTTDITATTGSGGKAGIVHFGSEYWVSEWQNDTVFVLDNAGIVISFFNVPLSAGGGIRAMSTDGSSVYASQNAAEVIIIDIATKSVTGNIALPSLGFNVRSVSYDPTANSGAGGLWVSNFTTDIVLVSMTGAVLSTIPATTHGLTGMYGMAVDNITSLSTKTLWIFDQPGNPGAVLWQLDAATGNLTGATLDVNASLGYASLAGGVCIATNLPSFTQPSLCCIIQQVPNTIEGFELTLPVGLNEELNSMNIGVFPIPATDYIYFVINDVKSSAYNVEVFNAAGSLVAGFTSNDKKITVATGDFASGIYTAKISAGGTVTCRKFIVK